MVTQSPTANPRRSKQNWQSQTWWCFLPVLGIALCISVFALTRVSYVIEIVLCFVALPCLVAQSTSPSLSHRSHQVLGHIKLWHLRIRRHSQQQLVWHTVTRTDKLLVLNMMFMASCSHEIGPAGHNSEGLSGPLDFEQCKQVPKLRMCSHQMKGASTTWGVLAALR